MKDHSSMRSFRLLAIALGMIVASGIAIGLLRTPFLDGSEKLQQLTSRFSPSDPIGIYQEDPIYGWSHRPGSRGRHRVEPDFDVTYTIDASGHRHSGPPSEKPKIVALGGSFTFGYGVHDSEAYPAILEESLPDYDVINAGVMAWGTTHAWLKLKDILATNDDVRLVLYGFIEHHIRRNWLRRSWLTMLIEKQGRRSPFVEIENDRPVFRGLAHPEHDGMSDSEEVDQKEIEISTILLTDLSRLCRENDIPFILVRLPDGTSPRQSDPLQPALDLVESQGAVIDLRNQLASETYRFPGNNHPNPAGHREIAQGILPVVKSHLRLAPEGH